MNKNNPQNNASSELVLTLRKKIVRDYGTLNKILRGLRLAGYKIVLTIGSWDMLHIGHVRYLIAGKEKGNILVVGTDSDRVVKKTKGAHRPIIPEDERMEMLSYQLPVDFVTRIDDVDKKGQWKCGLLRRIKPDVFIAVKGDSYSPKQKQEIRKYCNKLVVLPRQAENTSSTAIIQEALKKNLSVMMSLLDTRGGKS
ncbi:MAG: Bifunctional synthase/transferase [Candidatus Giovannonibacteria bacterium GW2011_GWC2_44_9]|uniref:Bifunctional synthase/transferase n=3 Tax=Candidatus Giovannoniibacteriota TaxID=1752738 RepID=A0A0G1L6W5_9BACT|nr:MAG: Bifunctional synthase/transferase [Candidatus Giovannonibacteria bacterium GW2011_GWB1_44_23]KKT64362.1 MAG: Bifunctional synthase/transferase [Candidatus Giovannonibacteria bacterium GW2011_GWA1_44_29]KKT84317.1 MAG: Bifunctional synthase/transferase [Candidatus Giovannonibacteria bacterium GW2011_GWC2_44_9]KKT92089.1 MAG: Bifunctional synthase/transferase [Parcubacteria group bacterium GW2011_GWC1_45_13]